MKYINDINITEAVMHVLDRDADKPILNDFSLELNEDAYTYIYNLVTKCLNDEKLLYAKFLDKETDPELKVLSISYFSGLERNILEISKTITKRLFELVKSNCNLSSSDLLIASILTDQGPMIAILNMDYEDKNFKHDITFSEDEKVMINLVKDHKGLPKTAGKVQKAAFILPNNSDVFDLMILDKRKGRDNPESNYFVNTFLKAQYVTNERDLTKKLLGAMELWTIKKCACNAIKAEDTRSVIRRYCAEEDIIKLEDIADELYTAENDHEEFMEYCKGMGIPKEVPIDRTWFDKHKSKINFEIEKDIKLTMNSGIYNNPSRFEIQANKDGSIDFIIKNIMNYKEK